MTADCVEDSCARPSQRAHLAVIFATLSGDQATAVEGLGRNSATMVDQIPYSIGHHYPIADRHVSARFRPFTEAGDFPAVMSSTILVREAT